MQSKLTNIVDYYNTCESDYRTFWDLDRSMAMHAGFWDDRTQTLSDALARENEILAEIAQVKQGDKVLDAGCGVGGSSLFLAKHFGCQVVGITLSEKQVITATNNAKKEGVGSLVHFAAMDFCETSFPDASFDVVWGIESICHAEDKLKFVKEAYRLLKKGGRLVMADGFGVKNSYTDSEAKKMSKWLNGWGVDSLDMRVHFQCYFEETGFSQVSYRNVTAHVMPSSKRLYWISFPAFILSKMGEWLGVRNKIQTENILAAYYQYTTLRNGLWEYGIFSCIKDQ